MARISIGWLASVSLVALGCGGGSATGMGGHDGGTDAPRAGDAGCSTCDAGRDHAAPDAGRDGGAPHGDASATDAEAGGPRVDNVAPMIVNAGPKGSESVDVPFISVTLCAPGTSNCQTIDYVTVDTGSSGLRVISSVLSKSLALPQQTTGGDPLAECYTFDDGYTWGSVRRADIKIAGEVARNAPIQVIGDPAFGTVPKSCSSTGAAEDTVDSFGSYALIGINQIVPDCGSNCEDAAYVAMAPYYYACGSSCTGVTQAVADQIANPIAAFGLDGNGSVIDFPNVPPGGQKTLAGSLIFGIGTATNNGLGSASVLTTDDYGNIATVFDGKTLSMSFLDTGTNSFAFNDSSITQCKGGLGGWYCPASTTSLSAVNRGRNDVTTTVSFSVANTRTLFSDLAGTGSAGSFDWGLPFFIGRRVYVALQGASTPGGDGPYFAY
jgi:Protein of unknown function (DUF3443)